MAGIYIHIPFCKQACSYCDFHFSTNQALRQALVDALCKEITLRKSELNTRVETIYFGGGSPSILNNRELSQIFEALQNAFDLSHAKEITLESNPDDHSQEKLELWKSLGINRLSIGIQSFINRDLKLMNRAHNAKEAVSCIEKAKSAGFHSMSIDLIYGIPGQSLEEWQQNIDQAIALSPEHISAYCLTIEAKTALDHQIKQNIIAEKSDEQIEAEYLFLHHKLTKAGFNHYEISNFCKPGKEAMHNSNYWNGKPYLGIGPAAHSFDGNVKRSWNIANNPKYIKALKSGALYSESETLSSTDRFNEEMMTGLRHHLGFDYSKYNSVLQKGLLNNLDQMPGEWRRMLSHEKELLKLDPEHWLLTDLFLKHMFLEFPQQ
ncbi:MAG: radical SAM family heme chaperone HemW [Salibacteraceae bacterium]